jgi:hypothetical protein
MKFKEMSKRAKFHIIFMFICGVIDIILSILSKNILTLFVGIMFLLEILETYTREEKDKIINKYNDVCNNQNDMLKWAIKKIDELTAIKKEHDRIEKMVNSITKEDLDYAIEQANKEYVEKKELKKYLEKEIELAEMNMEKVEYKSEAYWSYEGMIAECKAAMARFEINEEE